MHTGTFRLREYAHGYSRHSTAHGRHDKTERMSDRTDLKVLLDTPPWDWPSDAAETFQQILTDKQAKEADRLIAVELAGDYTVINDTLAVTLLNVIGSADQSTEMRARAAISLGSALEGADEDGFDEPDDVPISESMASKIQGTLHQLYLDQGIPKEVRRKIFEASVRSPLDWHKDAIRKAYSSGDRDWKLTAVFAMGWIRGFDKQILEALENSDPEIHLEAVEAAGNWELSCRVASCRCPSGRPGYSERTVDCCHRRCRQYPSKGSCGSPRRPARIGRRRDRRRSQ